MRRRLTAGALALGMLAGCGGDRDFERISLQPGPNPFGPDHPLWSPQPRRDHPYGVALSNDGQKLLVTLQGSEDEPGTEVAMVDTVSRGVERRVRVGSGPTAVALHPAGRFAVVTNRFSNFASVIDVDTGEVSAEIEVPFYTIDLAFTPGGDRAFLTNRWTDSVLVWDLEVGDRFEVRAKSYQGYADRHAGIPVGDNPRDLAISADGKRLYVASPTSLSLSIIDTATYQERRVPFGSPPGDVALDGDRLFVSHTGFGTHHPPDLGHDTDGDGLPGDGTANVMFQDLQNEVAVLGQDAVLLHNYTSDSICCHDYRDVDPGDPTRGEKLPPGDGWPASRLAYLPDQSTWTVACALPEQLAVTGQRLLVVCSGSNEVQGFDIEAGGLVPRQQAGGLYRTGMNPAGIVVSPDGARAYVAERLGEHVTVLDLEAGPGHETRILVGDESGGPFPATDAELGEAVNFVTAPFTVDGDQTCVHCHREGGNLQKPVAMPLQADPVWGTRMQMAYRGAFDTRPWFFESAMDENNFFPVINEFGRKENFCCEQLDPLIWSNYPSVTSCLEDKSQAGCNHVLDCPSDPPPECAARRYGSPHLLRTDHFLAAAEQLFGRKRAFGDALYDEHLDEHGEPVREGIRLDFTGVTRAVGLFLLSRPRFFPNPNAAVPLAAAARGRLVYESPETGCASCHPLPTTSVSPDYNPFAVPLRFAALVTPVQNPETGADADMVNPKFIGTFPETRQDAAGLHLGVPQLRGIWDRARRFYHDGRAPSLREALATPGHAALREGEIGFNETHGMPDTHGATSHLTEQELADLVAFLLAL